MSQPNNNTQGKMFLIGSIDLVVRWISMRFNGESWGPQQGEMRRG
ncbi:hypothetical protein MHY1_01324 [Methylovirgula sp. HY1]|nr:hypothetical protein MHY1_01324 [Methylovirgula sp. HY1]